MRAERIGGVRGGRQKMERERDKGGRGGVRAERIGGEREGRQKMEREGEERR